MPAGSVRSSRFPRQREVAPTNRRLLKLAVHSTFGAPACDTGSLFQPHQRKVMPTEGVWIFVRQVREA